VSRGGIIMIRLRWKKYLHTYFAGRLLGQEYNADEGYVTQLLENGQSMAVADFDTFLHEIYIHR